jgi:uncharacterized surface protein with fasciclin (FAS1) repeats
MMNETKRLLLMLALAGAVLPACGDDDEGGGGNGGGAAGGSETPDAGPVGGEDPPVGGEDPPVGGEDPPVGGEEPPVGGEEPPVGGEEPPVGGEEPPLLPSLAEIAVGDDRFETLVTAATAAGLVDTLNGDDKYTIFAPTDEAFAALPAGVLDTLLADTDALTFVLLYHAVPGEQRAADVVAADTLTAANGLTLDVTVEGESVKINDANIVEVDILARNGVVHVIDAVLVPPAEPELPNLVDLLVNDGRFSTLATAVTAAGLLDAVGAEDANLTVFAPTDEAFAALPAGALDSLLADPAALAGILLYHAVPGIQDSAAVVAADSFVTVAGLPIDISVEGDTVRVNDATILEVDLRASNGIAHVIDGVLLPPAEEQPTITDIVVNSEVHNTLEAAVIAAGLAETLAGEGTFTVFAPTDDAFAALPAGTVEALLGNIPALTNILLYHVSGSEFPAAEVVEQDFIQSLAGQDINVVVTDEGAFVNGAQIIVTDIEASNGVVHVIDSVLLPPTITDIVVGDPRFTTLTAAVVAADLADTLAGAGPFTVFAPTDDAFAALRPGTVEALLNDIPTLTSILLYHVVSGAVDAETVVGLDSAETVNGADVSIRVENGSVFVNDSQVIITDINATNGIVHVIDAVLLPPAN